ncbi:hypothetical protein DF3PA_70145 [Candidatus Defluviicoccus seviourii]|uniref:Uncharacterized protein n=2 Tax=root TaxID=1 RepID=A0A564WJK4_9PROT|nr:hypothetical protein DF3PB_2160004 [uncultured Defluviicoccus sp.]VUX47824.1 hypothetical protein DF3PA_70145 [Candidatus Defluviicoccus seviourii]
MRKANPESVRHGALSERAVAYRRQAGLLLSFSRRFIGGEISGAQTRVEQPKAQDCAMRFYER